MLTLTHNSERVPGQERPREGNNHWQAEQTRDHVIQDGYEDLHMHGWASGIPFVCGRGHVGRGIDSGINLHLDSHCPRQTPYGGEI